MAAVVLFDGVCNFCDASVNFIIERDREGYFKFAALQSDRGKALAREHGLESEIDDPSAENVRPIDSVILIEDGKAYAHSTAALRIARHLGPTVVLDLRVHRRAGSNPRFFLSPVCEIQVSPIRTERAVHAADARGKGKVFIV